MSIATDNAARFATRPDVYRRQVTNAALADLDAELAEIRETFLRGLTNGVPAIVEWTALTTALTLDHYAETLGGAA